MTNILGFIGRYIMSLAVADWSGQAWLQGFNDVGVAVFGMPANELVEIRVRISFISHCAFLLTSITGK